MPATKLENLKAINGGGQDSDLQFCLDAAEGMVLDYCHLTALPDALATTVVLIAKDIYKGSGFGTAQGEIASVKEADQTIQYVTGKGEGYLDKYLDRLAQYRKIGW